jgi:iron complex outermembrane receptor protein
MSNLTFVPRLLPLLIAASLVPVMAHADEPVTLTTVVVEGVPQVMAPANVAGDLKGVPSDAAEMLTRVPGAAVVRNGAQSGIVQLRGLFNERVRVRVDGMSIAPLRGGVSADYSMQAWRVGGEWILSARKDTVAAYNTEPTTPGYGVLNLYAGVTPLKNLNLTAGVDNVLDKQYYDPLAGVSRVAGGSVPVGGIMPGMGRSLYVKMDWTY